MELPTPPKKETVLKKIQLIMKIKTLLLLLLLSLTVVDATAQGIIERKKPKPAATQQNKTNQPKKAKKSTGSSSKPATSVSYQNGTLRVGNVSYKMVYVQGGTFIMGATSEQGGDAWDEEKPAHQVTLSSYSIGQTEVTQALWEAVMGNNPSFFKGDNLPVERVSWDDCQEFVRKLNRLTGKNFRLPTEAEWEYAARGGSKSRGYKYSGSNTLGNVAWYDDNSGSTTHPVGTKSSNELNLYDMSGNVYEWCNDWYGDYSGAPQANPTGPNGGKYHVERGGSCFVIAKGCRVSNHAYNHFFDCSNELGLRLALSE